MLRTIFTVFLLGTWMLAQQAWGQSGWEVEWKRVLEAARKEGKVAVAEQKVLPDLNEFWNNLWLRGGR